MTGCASREVSAPWWWCDRVVGTSGTTVTGSWHREEFYEQLGAGLGRKCGQCFEHCWFWSYQTTYRLRQSTWAFVSTRSNIHFKRKLISEFWRIVQEHDIDIAIVVSSGHGFSVFYFVLQQLNHLYVHVYRVRFSSVITVLTSHSLALYRLSPVDYDSQLIRSGTRTN